MNNIDWRYLYRNVNSWYNCWNIKGLVVVVVLGVLVFGILMIVVKEEKRIKSCFFVFQIALKVT